MRTSLFFNYNWNRGQLGPSVAFAEKLGRDPLDLYAGVNMQGGEPGGTSWSLLPDQRVSIGLWGAHLQNMFWESRAELGSSDEMKQFAYLRRTECYFGGGNRNRLSLRLLLTSTSTQHTTRLGMVWLHS